MMKSILLVAFVALSFPSFVTAQPPSRPQVFRSTERTRLIELVPVELESILTAANRLGAPFELVGDEVCYLTRNLAVELPYIDHAKVVILPQVYDVAEFYSFIASRGISIYEVMVDYKKFLESLDHFELRDQIIHSPNDVLALLQMSYELQIDPFGLVEGLSRIHNKIWITRPYKGSGRSTVGSNIVEQPTTSQLLRLYRYMNLYHLSGADLQKTVTQLRQEHPDGTHLQSTLHGKWSGWGLAEILEHLEKSDSAPGCQNLLSK